MVGQNQQVCFKKMDLYDMSRSKEICGVDIVYFKNIQKKRMKYGWPGGGERYFTVMTQYFY